MSTVRWCIRPHIAHSGPVYCCSGNCVLFVPDMLYYAEIVHTAQIACIVAIHNTICGVCNRMSIHCGTWHSVWTVLYNIHTIVVYATLCGVYYTISTLLWYMPPYVECVIEYLHYCGTCHSVWTVLYNIHTIMVHVTLCGVCYTISTLLWYMPPYVECVIQYPHYHGTYHLVWSVLYNIHTIVVHATLCGVCYTVSAALWYALMLVSMLCDLWTGLQLAGINRSSSCEKKHDIISCKWNHQS